MYRHLMFIFSSDIVYSQGVSGTVWTHNNHALQLSWHLSLFPSSFVLYVFLWFFQSLKIIMLLILPVIELLSVFTFPWHVGVFLCDVMNVRVCVSCYTWVCVTVSAENLEKSLKQMERQLLQLERDLETFSSPDDPNDMFFTKMAISFSHACVHTPVRGIIHELTVMN